MLLDRLDTARRDRMVILDMFGEKALVPCVCPAGQARAILWRNMPREAAAVYLDNGSIAPLPQQRLAIDEIRAFLANPRGWLTLVGGFGLGKTRLIYAALNHLADMGVYGRYVMMPDLLNELRDAMGGEKGDYGERLRRLVEAPLLAIDELDKIRESTFVEDVFYAIFLRRYQERETTATIIGYNADGAERLPAFLRSRIRDSRFRLIEMAGPDLRPIADKLDPWDRGDGER